MRRSLRMPLTRNYSEFVALTNNIFLNKSNITHVVQNDNTVCVTERIGFSRERLGSWGWRDPELWTREHTLTFENPRRARLWIHNLNSGEQLFLGADKYAVVDNEERPDIPYVE